MKKSNKILAQIKSFFLINYWYVFLTSISILGLFISVVVFYPGYMSPDSISQYGQAVGLFTLHDWHPPVMTLLWGLLISITDLTGSMLVFQLTLLWLSLLLLSLTLYRVSKRKWLSVFPFTFAFLPYVMNFSGVIWKDVQMAYSLLLAAVVIYTLIILKGQLKKWQTITLYIVGIVCLFYALTIRYNAIFAIIPILILLAGQIYNRRRTIAIVCVVFVALSFGVNYLISSMNQVEESNPITSVMLDDVVNIAPVNSISNANIDSALKNSLVSVKNCLTEDIYLNLYWICADPNDRQNISVWHPNDMKKIWLDSILESPGQYIAYRAQSLSWFLFPANAYVWQSGIEKNDLGLEVRYSRLGEAVSYYVNTTHRNFGFLFEAWFWLIMSGLIVYFSSKRKFRFKPLVIALGLSSILYIVGYTPVVVATDYRYVYWPALASTLAILLIYIDTRVIYKKSRINMKSKLTITKR